MNTRTRSEQAHLSGAKSKAPITTDDKRVSSMNRFIHGRRSRHHALLTDEGRTAFESLQNQLIRGFVPRTNVETDLVAQLAFIEWRKLRVDAVALAMLNHEYAIQRDALATSHVAHNSRLPAFLATRSRQYVRERAAILRTLEHIRKLSSEPTFLQEVFSSQDDNPDFGSTFEPHSDPAAEEPC
jgi:hypothetical protein